MTYRDDLEAAKLRRNALARELREVRQRMDELERLGERARELEHELDRSAGDVDRARAKVKLPLLQQVRVASPCKERWSEMTGDDRVRFCGRCEKNVYDLSALTAEQADDLLRAHGESLCVRFYRRRDGTVMTSDCPVGHGKRRFQRIAAAALTAGILAAGGGFAASSRVCQPEPLMGEVTILDPAGFAPEELTGQMTMSEPVDTEYEALTGDVAFEPADQERHRAGAPPSDDVAQ